MKLHEKQAPTKVSQVEIGPEQEGQRIDNFLLTKLKGVPKTHVYRILRKGEVRVNKGRIRPDYRLKSGDIVRIPPVRTASSESPAPVGDRIARQLQGAVLYENSHLLIVDKPAGIAVHGGSGVRLGIIEALRALRPEARFLELVHRLDRDTSGCLIIAKRRSALRDLHEQLRTGAVEKHYLALVKGRLQGKRVVEAPLRKNVLRSGERVVRVSDEGKPAHTQLAPAERYRDATLVDVRLLTGRTHQIRVHAAHIGHPLAGDDKYGDEDFNRVLRETAGLRRLFLHARSLAFTDPAGGETLTVTAPLPPELDNVLNKLKLIDE